MLLIIGGLHFKNQRGLEELLKGDYTYGTMEDIPQYSHIYSPSAPINTSLYPDKVFFLVRIFPSFQIRNYWGFTTSIKIVVIYYRVSGFLMRGLLKMRQYFYLYTFSPFQLTRRLFVPRVYPVKKSWCILNIATPLNSLK